MTHQNDTRAADQERLLMREQRCHHAVQRSRKIVRLNAQNDFKRTVVN